jgi:hypothetical protein
MYTRLQGGVYKAVCCRNRHRTIQIPGCLTFQKGSMKKLSGLQGKIIVMISKASSSGMLHLLRVLVRLYTGQDGSNRKVRGGPKHPLPR